MAQKSAGLGSFLARPGEAKPSGEGGQRGQQRGAQPSTEVRQTKGQGVRALTLRVDNELYDRLRRFAFDRELTHQEVLEAALRGHLDVHGG